VASHLSFSFHTPLILGGVVISRYGDVNFCALN